MKISVLTFVLRAILVAAIFVCGSCSTPFPSEASGPAGSGYVKWSIVSDLSRARLETDGRGEFVPGDTIVVSAHNVTSGLVRRYVLHLESDGWKPFVPWSEVGNGEVIFTAWHASPSGRLVNDAGDSESSYVHRIETQQDGEGYLRSDLLVARTHVQAGETVALCFGHALHRLRIRLESPDGSFDGHQIAAGEIRVRTACRIPFDLSEGTSGEPAGYQWVTPLKESDNTWTALLCPQEAGDLRSEDWIQIRIGDKELAMPLPESLAGQPLERLEAGKEIVYRIRLRKEAEPDAFSGTTRWVYGIKEPLPEQWNADHTQLKWTDGCGWFDCNKVNPSGITSGDDGLMCWAASASNLIHWWLAQNAGTEAVRAYQGPEAVPSDMLHSQVFQLYKDHFPNRGEYPLKAVNWFFNGVFQKRIYETDPVDPSAGFFRPWLGTNSLGKEYSNYELTRDGFNRIVKHALSSGQGMMFVINLGKNWSTHAVTLWGVSFDESGLADTLYMVDNNDGRYDARGTIRAMKVKYLPYSSSNSELYPYVPNSLGDFTIRIESLCTLSLGREWIK